MQCWLNGLVLPLGPGPFSVSCHRQTGWVIWVCFNSTDPQMPFVFIRLHPYLFRNGTVSLFFPVSSYFSTGQKLMRWFSKWSGQESAPFWFVSKYLFIDFSGRFFWDRTDGSLSISICLGRGAATDRASICRAPAFLAVSWGNWRWDRLCSCPWGVENLMEQGRQLWISQEFTSEFIFWL